METPRHEAVGAVLALQAAASGRVRQAWGSSCAPHRGSRGSCITTARTRVRQAGLGGLERPACSTAARGRGHHNVIVRSRSAHRHRITGSWLSSSERARALHANACRKFRAPRSLLHFYGQFWQAFPKGFRRPKATTFKSILSQPEALVYRISWARCARRSFSVSASLRQRRRLAERALHAPALGADR